MSEENQGENADWKETRSAEVEVAVTGKDGTWGEEVDEKQSSRGEEKETEHADLVVGPARIQLAHFN